MKSENIVIICEKFQNYLFSKGMKELPFHPMTDPLLVYRNYCDEEEDVIVGIFANMRDNILYVRNNVDMELYFEFNPPVKKDQTFIDETVDSLISEFDNKIFNQ